LDDREQKQKKRKQKRADLLLGVNVRLFIHPGIGVEGGGLHGERLQGRLQVSVAVTFDLQRKRREEKGERDRGESERQD
jgi:hypothetical protein